MQHHYLAIPNYYGGDSVVLRWMPKTNSKKKNSKKKKQKSLFREIQRIKSDGAGSIESFTLPTRKHAEVGHPHTFTRSLAYIHSVTDIQIEPHLKNFLAHKPDSDHWTISPFTSSISFI